MNKTAYDGLERIRIVVCRSAFASLFRAEKPLMILGLSLLLLSGCGFQLRGPVRLPEGISGLDIKSADALSPMSIELHRALGQNALKPKAGEETSDSGLGQLEVLSESVRKEILSVNDRARVSEFVLIAEVSVRLLAPANSAQSATDAVKELMPTFSLTARREYSFDERQALGTAQEEEIITRELRQELAQGVLLKISQR